MNVVKPLLVVVLTISIFDTVSLAADPVEGSSKASCADDVCVRVVRRAQFLSFEVENKAARPAFVSIELTSMKNVKALEGLPFRARVEAHQRKVVGAMAIQDERNASQYRYQWTKLQGDPKVEHDDSWHYRMPFGGNKKYRVSQGYKGQFTHKGPGAYALDFPMPWGTPILASRSGVVVKVVNDEVAGGITEGSYNSANQVTIEHVDGTYASYVHLRHGNIAKVDQEVQTGDLIGLSGDTGHSSGPHLHFEVWKATSDGGRQTIPVRFYDGSPRGFTPIRGLAYSPGCSTTGGFGCRKGPVAPDERRPAAAKLAPARQPARRLSNGACQCPNGATLHVDLPCELVCGR